jgi:two-component system cell cycle sensor histidine kinase/response regulator CckA
VAELDAESRRRLELLLEQISAIGQGQFGVRGAVSPALDEIDAVAAGLDVLAEDFEVERGRRERAEASLRDALDGFEYAPALLCSVDAASGVLLRVNSTLARTLQRSGDDLLGRPLHEIYRPGGRAQLDDALAAVRAGRPAPGGDHELVRADGRSVLVSLSGSAVEGPEGVVRLRLAFRDVTEERRLEAQLQHAQKMEGIGRLAGGIAHDFNNLLTAIFGSAGMLQPVVEDDPGAREDLRELVGAAERAAELTSQLLAFSRRTVVKPVVVDVNDCLRRFEKLLRRTLGARIEIVLSLWPDAWSVFVDPARLEQAILNLAVNARDAMPEGGRLTLETQNVVLDEEHARLHLGLAGGDYLVLAVHDDGVGMSRESSSTCSSRSTPRRRWGRARGSGSRWCTASSARRTARSSSTASPAAAPGSACTCRAPSARRRIPRRPAAAPRAAPSGC